MKLSREIVHSLYNTGMSFAEIGRMYNRTRQFVWSLYSGYDTIYHHTEKYRMYKRHQWHGLKTRLNKPCELCVNEKSVIGVA